MGSKRQEHIEALFSHPAMKAHFEPPAFSPGVPQRELRNRMGLLTHAGEAGIIPEAEWKALSSPEAKRLNDDDPLTLLHVLDDVPVKPGRMGGDFDVKMHYAKELWQKGKGINRGRSVLGCALAHLKAMRMLVEEGYDFILEDNVRAPITNANRGNLSEQDEMYCECAERIRNARDASLEWEEATGKKCHLRYHGWLGSRPNLEFVMNTHCPKMKFTRKDENETQSFFPFPIPTDIEQFLGESDNKEMDEEAEREDDNKTKMTKPGGTPIWGAFAYWVSKEGYEALIESLQKDVGALLWKGKRMRCYQVKPIDKIIPRRIMAALSETENHDGRDHIHVATHPSFFRAPMLTSQIHSQWDAEFCRSTEFQMKRCNQEGISKDDDREGEELEWQHLWLTKEETQIVEHRQVHTVWLTLKELAELSEGKE